MLRGSWKMWIFTMALVCATACADKKPKEDAPAQPTTAFGNELPEPVDDSVIEKSDETPEQPVIK